MLRTIKAWVEIFGKLDATSVSAEQAIASRILGDLTGYRDNSHYRASDVMQLANAIQAYAKMLQDVGVKIVD